MEVAKEFMELMSVQLPNLVFPKRLWKTLGSLLDSQE